MSITHFLELSIRRGNFRSTHKQCSVLRLTARSFMPVLLEVIASDLRDIWVILLNFKDSMAGVGDKITFKGPYLRKNNVMARTAFQVLQAKAPVTVK